MNEPESVGAALEAAASHPTVQKTVAAATSVIGTMAIVSNVQTLLGVISLGIGILIGFVTLRNGMLQGRLLERQLAHDDEVKS